MEQKLALRVPRRASGVPEQGDWLERFLYEMASEHPSVTLLASLRDLVREQQHNDGCLKRLIKLHERLAAKEQYLSASGAAKLLRAYETALEGATACQSAVEAASESIWANLQSILGPSAPDQTDAEDDNGALSSLEAWEGSAPVKEAAAATVSASAGDDQSAREEMASGEVELSQATVIEGHLLPSSGEMVAPLAITGEESESALIGEGGGVTAAAAAASSSSSAGSDDEGDVGIRELDGDDESETGSEMAPQAATASPGEARTKLAGEVEGDDETAEDVLATTASGRIGDEGEQSEMTIESGPESSPLEGASPALTIDEDIISASEMLEDTTDVDIVGSPIEREPTTVPRGRRTAASQGGPSASAPGKRAPVDAAAAFDSRPSSRGAAMAKRPRTTASSRAIPAGRRIVGESGAAYKDEIVSGDASSQPEATGGRGLAPPRSPPPPSSSSSSSGIVVATAGPGKTRRGQNLGPVAAAPGTSPDALITSSPSSGSSRRSSTLPTPHAPSSAPPSGGGGRAGVRRPPSPPSGIPVGGEVVIQCCVDRETGQEDWILGTLLRVRPDGSYEVEDVEDVPDGNGGFLASATTSPIKSGRRMKFTVRPGKIRMIPPKAVEPEDNPIKTRERVLALYPGTTCMYPATVVSVPTRRRRTNDFLVKFHDDTAPHRAVPSRYVLRLE